MEMHTSIAWIKLWTIEKLTKEFIFLFKSAYLFPLFQQQN